MLPRNAHRCVLHKTCTSSSTLSALQSSCPPAQPPAIVYTCMKYINCLILACCKQQLRVCLSDDWPGSLSGTWNELHYLTMSALASLPARAAARVKALNADAPKLAAAATGPLRKADLLNPRASVLLSMLAVPDLLQADMLENGLTLHKARLIYYNTNVIRRIVWRDIFAEPAVNGDADGAVVEQLGYALQTLCLMRAPACTPLPPCAPLENAHFIIHCPGALCNAG